MCASKTKATQLNIKEPSKKEKAKWQPLVEACIAACLETDRTDNRGNSVKVRISYSNYREQRIKGFVVGRIVERNGKGVVVEYCCMKLLTWLYKHKLSDKNPNMVFIARKNQLQVLSLMEKKLDEMLDIN